jgi:hypothetical protein
MVTGPESAAEAGHTGSGWEHLVLILTPKDGTLVGVANMQEYFFPLVEVGGGFKDAAVTTTYVDNITGLKVELL